MKKFLLILSAVSLLLAGCAKDEAGSETGTGEMVKASFTAVMQGTPQTKTVTDGQGSNVTRCVMEIYYKGVLYTRDVKPIEGMKTTFAPRLVSNRTYDVLFWADCGEGLADKYYTTNAEGLGLQAVEMIGTSYAANDDARDAFFVKEQVEVLQQVSSKTFELKRPFAQVNIITTDASIIEKDILYPDGVEMVYTAPTKFNLLTGELSKEEKLTVTGVPYETFNKASEALTLAMDYLFTDASVINIEFKASKTGETAVTKHSFTNIPVKRNYRTNIKGALLTTTGQWTAEIKPAWDGEEDVPVAEVGSVAAANEAFKKGATNVKITSVGDETTLYLPLTTADVTIDFATPDKDVTVKYGPEPTTAPVPAPTTKGAEEGDKPSVVNIATNDVTKFKVTGISNIVWLAGNQAALANALTNAEAGQTVALANDITMTENWVSVARGSNTPNFDGRNHAIINMKIKTQEESYAGLFSTIENHVILQNVTFRNALIDIPASIGDNARGGVLVGHMYPSDVVNCHVEGATIKAHQKMGGLIGYVEGYAANKTISIKDCSVKDITLSSNVQGSKTIAGVGGLIGHLVLSQADLITVENNSVENIIITDSKPITGSYNWDEYGQYLPHAFVGNACQNYKGGEPASESKHSIVLMNNRILGTNTELSTCIYSSEYFGWGGNAEETPSWTGKIYIDGQEWTPNYPVKIVGGKGYATLAEALTAASAGQTVQILKAGEYTFPGNTKKAIIVEGLDEKDADGNYVVAINLNGVSEYNENLTFKHLTFNFTNSEGNDRGFTHCVNMTYNECVFTGLMWGYDSQVSTFNDCLFHQATKYNVWSYGGNLEFNRCLFQTSTGTIVNVYATGTDVHEVRFNDCTFESLNDVLDKGAILLKGGKNHGHVIVNNYTLKGKFQNNGDSAKYINSADGLYMFSLRDGDFCDAVYITVNGVTHYPYFTIDANGNYSVKNANGLKMAIKHWNALKAAGEKSLTLADGTYNVSDMAIFQNYADKSLLIKAENNKQAVITPNSGSKQLIFVVAGMSKSYAGHITVDGLKFDMSGAANKEIESDVISISDAVGTNLPADEKALYSGTYHYGHDITVKNCEIIGLGSDNEHSSVVRTENQNAYNVKVQNCTIDKVGYVLTSKISTLAEVSGCTITDSKCVINSTVNNTEYKIIGNTISTYNNYCIRLDYGPIEVKDNNFNITWTKETGEIPTKHEPAIVVLRNSTGNMATITGNTSSKADDTMYDIYCKTSWIVNGTTIPAENDLSF